MDFTTIVFYLFAAIVALSACVVVFSTNIVRSAFSLLFTFFGVAGLYVLLRADFLAITQIMIYIGGILVLILFGVMLTNRSVNVDMKTSAVQTLPGILLTAAVLVLLGGTMMRTVWRMAPQALPETTGAAIGRHFLTDYLLPFEAASVVLLIAIIGAVMIARREKK